MYVPKGPCTSMVYTWAVNGVAVSLLWGLYSTYLMYTYICKPFGVVRQRHYFPYFGSCRYPSGALGFESLFRVYIAETTPGCVPNFGQLSCGSMQRLL